MPVNHYPAVNLNPGTIHQPDAGFDADSDDYHPAGDFTPVIQGHAVDGARLRVDTGYGVAGNQVDPDFLQPGGHHGRGRFVEHDVQYPVFHFHHADFRPSLVQRLGNAQPDKAAADNHHPVVSRQILVNRLGVVQGGKGKHPCLVDPLHRGHDGYTAGSQQQFLPSDYFTGIKYHRFPGRVKALRFPSEKSPDIILLVKVGRPEHHPLQRTLLGQVFRD